MLDGANLNNSMYFPGLEGVVAAETKLSRVDGQKGELLIGGFPLEEIAGNASFEEVVFLLWQGHLPTDTQLSNFQQQLAGSRGLSDGTVSLLIAAAAAKKPVMDALRMAAATLDLDSRSGSDHELAVSALAKMPTAVAAYWRLLNKQSIVAPNPELSHAANYLYMLTGDVPEESAARGMETYLITVSDHGLNASTFAARIVIATQSDMISAITGAIGALKGPLHGGAPGPALDMVIEIGEASRSEAYLRDKLERGERLMGFGHRVYKVRDPRAEVLSRAAARLFEAMDDTSVYDLAKYVEEVAVALLQEYKPERNLQTNVEFSTALLLYGLGLETDLFTPTFAVGRTAGWVAHCFEQKSAGRLIRPKANYVGEVHSHWIPRAERT